MHIERKYQSVINKKGVLQAQLISYMKASLVLLIVYLLYIILNISLQAYNGGAIAVSGIPYFFATYFLVYSFINLKHRLTYFSYHSYTRKSIINQTIVVQLIISLIVSIFLELVHILYKQIFFLNVFIRDDLVNTIYSSELVQQPILKLVIDVLFLTLIFFMLFQLANLVTVFMYPLSQKQITVVLLVVLILVLLIGIGSHYLPETAVRVILTFISMIRGISQQVVPAIVVPTIISLILSLICYLITLHKVKKLEIRRILSIV